MKTFTNSTTYKNIKYECMQYITELPITAYRYATIVLDKRWADIGHPEIEDIIGKDSYSAYCYARHVLKRRWKGIGKPEVEDLIATNQCRAYLYAKYIIKKRWADVGKPEIEDFVMQSGYRSLYKHSFK